MAHCHDQRQLLLATRRGLFALSLAGHAQKLMWGVEEGPFTSGASCGEVVQCLIEHLGGNAALFQRRD